MELFERDPLFGEFGSINNLLLIDPSLNTKANLIWVNVAKAIFLGIMDGKNQRIFRGKNLSWFERLITLISKPVGILYQRFLLVFHLGYLPRLECLCISILGYFAYLFVSFYSLSFIVFLFSLLSLVEFVSLSISLFSFP